MKWLLNSAVIPIGGYGHYEYVEANWEDLREFLADGDYTSRIGYPETATVIAKMTGLPKPPLVQELSQLYDMFYRGQIDCQFEPGDTAAVVRLWYRVDPSKKGQPVSEDPADWEVGFLVRHQIIECPPTLYFEADKFHVLPTLEGQVKT